MTVLTIPVAVSYLSATAAILLFQNNETTAMLVQTILWQLNSFLILALSSKRTLPFIPINLHGCWPLG